MVPAYQLWKQKACPLLSPDTNRACGSQRGQLWRAPARGPRGITGSLPSQRERLLGLWGPEGSPFPHPPLFHEPQEIQIFPWTLLIVSVSTIYFLRSNAITHLQATAALGPPLHAPTGALHPAVSRGHLPEALPRPHSRSSPRGNLQHPSAQA